MARRALTVTLLLVVAVQLIGSIAFAPACPCPDDQEGADCAPICTVCTSCTHAQQAIVQRAIDGETRRAIAHTPAPQSWRASSHPADEIFHIPLAG